MSYYWEPDSHTKDKVKVVSKFSHYADKKNYSVLEMLIHLI